jgi:hypothetical protein
MRPASGGRIDRGPWADRRAVDEPHVALPYVASGNPAADAMRVWVPTT